MAIEYFQVELRQGLQVGLPVGASREVLSPEASQLCSIPQVHPALMGVTTWRGQLLWHVSLSDLLCLRQDDANLRSLPTAIVVAAPDSPTHIGCWVSRLKGTFTVDAGEMEPLPEGLPDTIAPYFVGMVRRDARILLLNPDRLLMPTQWTPSAQSLPDRIAPADLASRVPSSIA
jgi:chemotaxis signal transduction protein